MEKTKLISLREYAETLGLGHRWAKRLAQLRRIPGAQLIPGSGWIVEVPMDDDPEPPRPSRPKRIRKK